jgi:hypothetical protein
MDSRKLSRRAIQPGNIRTFIKSEDAFHAVASRFDGGDGLRVVRNPDRLKRFYRDEGEDHNLGLRPEEEIFHVPTGRPLFFEVKNQGPRGNAEERAYRHHTEVFSRRLKDCFGLDYHPYFTIFTGNLATDPRYTLKFRFHILSTHYFLWKDYSTEAGLNDLYQYLAGLVNTFLLRKTAPKLP